MNPRNTENTASESEPTGENTQKTVSLRRFALPFLLFGLALAVRLIGLKWGLPNAARWYSYHPDESANQIVGAVVSLLQGDFNPHFFNYPSLSIYATWIFHQLLAGFGLATDAISPQYPWPLVRDIIFAGRLFSAGCGALTAPLIFLIARDLKMGRWAILAGILAALAPGHVQHSHFATVDVPATFFVTWCLYLILRAKNTRGLAWAALVAGLAAGTKYNAGLVLFAPLVALFFLPNRDESQISAKNRVLTGLALVTIAFVAFLATTPYALLASREFWGDGLRGGENGFAYELLVHPRIGSGEIFQGTGNGWIYHLTFNLPFVLTWPLVISAWVGIYFALKKRQFWPILAFVGLFLFSLGFSQVRYMRYLLPLAPILCLLAAYGASRLRFPKVWGAILTGFALVGSFNAVWPFTQTDPRDQLAGNMDFRAESIALANKPWFYTPPFQPRGFNIPVPGITITGFERAKIEAAGRFVAVSEFEWREAVRLQPQGDVALFLKSLKSIEVKKNRVPLALPGRDFVPHDYLYTNPQTGLYAVVGE